MSFNANQLRESLAFELNAIWQAHTRVGLKGEMQLYAAPTQQPWRSREPGFSHWFGPGGVEEAIDHIIQHINHGALPNTPLLLNPIVHQNEKPLGSGIAWTTSLSLGSARLDAHAQERLSSLEIKHGLFERGDNPKSGIKAVYAADRVLKAEGNTVEGCRALYDLANNQGEEYAPYYLLSGLGYLSTHGLYTHRDAHELFPQEARPLEPLVDAARCWNAYEHHHSLYVKFGRDPQDIEQNLKFFNLVAGDIQLFDATGPMREDKEQTFEFLVDGLIPRGAVTLLAASGGTGKSSAAHQLAVLAASDWDDKDRPKWLGQTLIKERSHGIVIYFSGEDGPPIVNARAKLFDPEGRAKRLMFQRTDFGDGVSFAQYLKRLHKIPEVPLMVIDPARKYLAGDEDDAGVVSEFFEAIEEFAIQKHCAVVVVHHLQKNAYPKTAREVLDMLRGSQVFIDRPRVVIGMFRDGPHTVVGLAKNNIPPNLGMMQEERVFARDPEKLQLLWLPGKEGVRSDTLPPEELKKLEKESKKDRG